MKTRERYRHLFSILRGLGAIVGALALTAGLALGALQTDPGRRFVEHRVEDALNRVLRGHIDIGRLEGNLVSRVVALDVVVLDAAGREAIRIPRLEVSHSVLALVRHTIRLHAVRLVDPVITARLARDGTLNLAGILPTSPADEPSTQPSRWRVVVTAVLLTGGRFTLDEVHVDGIELEVSGMELGQPFQTRGKGMLGGAPFGLDARIAPDPFAVAGSLQIDGVDPAAVWARAPAGKLALSVTADVAGTSLRTLRGTARVLARGQLGGTRIDQIVADAEIVDGKVRGRVAGRAPGAHVDVQGAVDVTARPQVVRSTKIDAQVTELGRFLGKLADGDVVANLAASGPIDDLHVAGSVRGSAVRYRDFRAGRVVVIGDFDGVRRDPVGRIRVDAIGVRRGTTTLGEVHAEGDFRDRGRHVRLSVRAGAPNRSYGIVASSQIDRGPDGRTVIRIGALSIRTRQLTWKGTGGSIAIEADGSVIIDDVALASAAGRVRGSGQLRPDGNRLHIALTDVRLEDLRRAVAPEAPDVRGTVNGRVSLLLRNHRVRKVDAHVDARDVVLRPGTDPIALGIGLGLEGRELEGNVAVDAGGTGNMKLDAALHTPLDPLDLEAWRRFDARDVRELHVALNGVDLPRVIALLDQRPGDAAKVAGKVDATVDVGPRFETLKARVMVAGLVTGYVDAPLSAEGELEVAGKKLHIEGRIQREGGGEVELAARIAAPTRFTSLEEWRRVDLKGVELATISFEDIALGWLPSIRRLTPDVEGTVTGTLTARTEGEAVVTADLRLDRVRTAPLRTPVSARLRTSIYEKRTTVELASTLGVGPASPGANPGDRRVVDVDGSIAAGLGALRARKPEAFLAAAVSARMTVERLPLALIGTAIDLPVPVDGALSMHADLSGPLRRPAIDGEASLDAAHVGNIAFGRLSLTGHLVEDHLTVAATAAQDGGSLEANLAVDLREAREGHLTLKARRFDLGFLAPLGTAEGLGLSKGILDADVSTSGRIVNGGIAHPGAKGWLKLTGGEARVAEALGTFHDARLAINLGPGDAVAVALDSRVGNEGSMKVAGTAKLVGSSLRDLRGTFETRKLSVATGGTTATVDARGSLSGSPEADLSAITVGVDGGTIALSGLSGKKLHPTGPPQDVVFVDPRGRHDEVVTKPGPPFLRIRLRTRKSVVITSEDLRAELDALMNVIVSRTEVGALGHLRVKGGFANLFGRRWALQPSTVELGGEVPPDPRLDVKLSYDFRTTTVIIALGGTLSKPKVTLSASPGNYDPTQLLGFVLGGSPDDIDPAGQRDVREQVLGAATGLLFVPILPLLGKAAPVDVLSVQTKTGVKQETLFTVGKWLSSDLYIAYQSRFANETNERQNANEGKLEWYFARRVRLDLIFGDQGEGSADVLWIRRW